MTKADPAPAPAPGTGLDAARFTERVRSAYGPDGRLAPPSLTGWDIFPFEGDLLVRHLADPVLPEPPRQGEDPASCDCHERTDDSYLWTDEHWRLGILAEPAGVPAYLLMPRVHHDLADLPDALAAELGVLIVRLDRILSAVPGVGRVHVNKWGDGGAHLHVWFFARPAGVLQLRGSCLPDWMEVLPPLPAADWDALAGHVAHELAGYGGVAHRSTSGRGGCLLAGARRRPDRLGPIRPVEGTCWWQTRYTSSWCPSSAPCGPARRPW